MRPLRVLWVCSHRTHRYEEVNVLLEAGVEVVPIATLNPNFPNAIDPAEETDPWYPSWRPQCTIPERALDRIRTFPFYATPFSLSDDDKALINEWFDVVIVASFSRLAADILSWFRGDVILRAFGGYPYSGVLRPWSAAGHRTLNRMGHSRRYHWCPILPYLSLEEDQRITQNELIVTAFVSEARLGARWAGVTSEAQVSEVISDIARYRQREFSSFIESFGSLPLRIFGHNPSVDVPGAEGRVAGTLSDEDYYSQIARTRVMLYVGLRSRNHLHYHPLEALAMGLPLIFLDSGSIAHHARYDGFSEEQLREMGMCRSDAEALSLAQQCVADVSVAVALASRQERLRPVFSRERASVAWRGLLDTLTARRQYVERFGSTEAGRNGSARAIVKAAITSALRTITG